MRGPIEYYREMVSTQIEPTRRARLEAVYRTPITAPTTLIWAAKDGALSARVAMNSELDAGCPVDLRPLPGVGHFVSLEAPDKLAREIRRLLWARAAPRSVGSPLGSSFDAPTPAPTAVRRRRHRDCSGSVRGGFVERRDTLSPEPEDCIRGGVMGWLEAIGYLASALVLSTFYMKTMIPLRWCAIAEQRRRSSPTGSSARSTRCSSCTSSSCP